MILGLVKTKLFAIFLGPSGLGILSVLNSTIELITQVFGFGTNSAVVREIASIDKENKLEIQEALNTIKVITFVQASIASIFTFVFSEWLSYLTFSSADFTTELRILALVVFITIIYKMNIAILEGLMIVKKYALQTVVSSTIVVSISALIVIYIGSKGIVLIIISSIVVHFSVSHIFQGNLLSKLGTHKFSISISVAKNIFYLGLTILSGGLISALSEYFARIYLLKTLGVVTVGYLYAAQSLAFLYTGFILTSISKFYFPKLASFKSNRASNEVLINNQIELGILLAIPGLMITFALSSLLISILYSASFTPSVEVLHWLTLVAFLKVASWPLSYFLVAVNSWKTFLIAEFASNLLYLGSLIFAVAHFGITGVGVAGVIQYLVYLTILLLLIDSNHKIVLEKRILMMLIRYVVLFLSLILCFTFFDSALLTYSSGLLAIVLSIDSINRLTKLIKDESLYTFLFTRPWKWNKRF